jgi:hypothetical protein
MSYSHNHRYAVYFSGEPMGEFWNLGSQWLSRCAKGACVKPLPETLGIDPYKLKNMTSQPRRYGWHATLKAPFALKEELGFEDLHQALNNLVQQFKVFEMPALEVKMMKNFLALAPSKGMQACPELLDVGKKCVEGLHALARPLNASEIAYRKSVPLSAREEVLMLKWGYPFVQELFEFHFTLSNNLRDYEAADVSAFVQAAKMWFTSSLVPPFDRISLFVEEVKGQDFKFLHDYSIPT